MTLYFIVTYFIGLILSILTSAIIPSLNNHSKTFWRILTVLFILSPIVVPIICIVITYKYMKKTV